MSSRVSIQPPSQPPATWPGALADPATVQAAEQRTPTAHNPAHLHRTLSVAVMEGQGSRSPSYLRTVVDRVTEEGSGILERMGLQPGREESLPAGQRFRLDEPTSRQWQIAAQRIGRASMAVVVVALLAAVLRMLTILSPTVWSIWKVAGIAAFLIGLLARHAELQLAAQLRAAQPGQAAEAAGPDATRQRSE